MAKCPWYGYGPTNCGSPACGGHLRYADWMCEGLQRNNETYRDCDFYVDKKNYAAATGHKCPQCIIEYGRGQNFANCISPNNPGTKGGTKAIRGSMSYRICAEGRTENGQKYTSCPYYTRKTSAEARAKGAGATVKPRKQKMSAMNIFVIVVMILTMLTYCSQR